MLRKIKNKIKKKWRRVLYDKITIGTSIFKHRDVKIIKAYSKASFEAPLFDDIFGKKHNLFSPYTCEIPESFVALISKGRCIVGHEEVYSTVNECFVEITSQKSNPSIGRYVPRKYKKISGVVANLALSGVENNYYHFCVEWLARLHLINKLKIHVDFFIVPQSQSFHSQYLDLLQIENNKRLLVNDGCLVEADCLVVPSFINNWLPVRYRGYDFYLKQWLPKWLPQIYAPFKSAPTGKVISDTSRLYISRKESYYRKLLNENEVIEILQRKGFKVFCLESLSVLEQIGLFKNAKFIVSMHGAGLVNMCHCDNSAVIFEIYTQYYHDSSFRLLALTLGHNYEYLIGKTITTNNLHPKEENAEVDIAMFKRAIDNIIFKYNL